MLAMDIWMRKSALASIAIALVLVLGIACAFFFLAQPIGDDFCLSVKGRDLGWIGAARLYYAEWSGRWLSHGFLAAVLSTFDPTRWYPVLLLILGAFHLTALYAFARTLLGERLPRKLALVLAAGFFGLLWAGRPAPGETIYWFSGAVAYPLSISLALLLFSSLSRPTHGWTGHSRFLLRCAYLSPIAICIPALNEVIGLMLCMVLALGTGLVFHVRGHARWVWLAVLTSTVIGFGIVYAAPGNGRRFPDHSSVSETLQVAMRFVLQNGPRWVLDPKLLAASLFFAINPRLAALRPAWLDRLGVASRWIFLPGVWMMMLAVGFIGPSRAMGGVPPRVLDCIYTVFVTGWFVVLFVWTRRPGAGKAQPTFPWRVAESAALVALAVALLLTGNTKTAISDLVSGRAVRWHASILERHEMLRHEDARQKTLGVLVPYPPPRPRLFYPFQMIDEDPRVISNQCMAAFFGLQNVVLQPMRRLGYDLVEERRVVNEAEAATVKEMFSLFGEHRSVRRVAKMLNSRGRHNKNGEPFAPTEIWRTLQDPLYIGKPGDGETHQDVQGPIIDTETWNRVQKILEQKTGLEDR